MDAPRITSPIMPDERRMARRALVRRFILLIVCYAFAGFSAYLFAVAFRRYLFEDAPLAEGAVIAFIFGVVAVGSATVAYTRVLLQIVQTHGRSALVDWMVYKRRHEDGVPR